MKVLVAGARGRLGSAVVHEFRARGEVVALARIEHRAIVTPNLRDFRPLHAELLTPGSAGHSGFVFVPVTFHLTRAAVGAVVAALEAKLAAYPGAADELPFC